jgi:hypothetical protein
MNILLSREVRIGFSQVSRVKHGAREKKEVEDDITWSQKK